RPQPGLATMTHPQEKLAAVIAEMRRTTPGDDDHIESLLAGYADRIEAAVASEHGGGGEAVAWLANDGTGRVIDAKAKDAARRAGGATASAMAAYTIPLHPPTPSAPVVD